MPENFWSCAASHNSLTQHSAEHEKVESGIPPESSQDNRQLTQKREAYKQTKQSLDNGASKGLRSHAAPREIGHKRSMSKDKENIRPFVQSDNRQDTSRHPPPHPKKTKLDSVRKNASIGPASRRLQQKVPSSAIIWKKTSSSTKWKNSLRDKQGIMCSTACSYSISLYSLPTITSAGTATALFPAQSLEKPLQFFLDCFMMSNTGTTISYTSLNHARDTEMIEDNQMSRWLQEILSQYTFRLVTATSDPEPLRLWEHPQGK